MTDTPLKPQPVAWQRRLRHVHDDRWTEWKDCSKEQADFAAANGRPEHFREHLRAEVRPLYTQDQLDAAVRAEREQVGFPTWATDEHIANGILEAAETIVQLVIHNQAHNIAEYTGVIKSHAGTLLTRRAHIAKFLAAAIREGD